MKPYALRSQSPVAGRKSRASFRLFSRKSRILAALPVAALALIVGGCEKAAAPDAKVLYQAIEDNANALNKKDVDAVMATIHPKAQAFDSTRDYVNQSFARGNLKFTMSDLKVKDASPEEAHVSFVQKTEQVEGDHAIPLNILEGVDTLRPDHGKWKIFETVVTNTTRLNGAPASTPEPSAPSPEPATPATPAPAATPGPTATPAPASTPTATEAKPPVVPGEKPPQ